MHRTLLPHTLLTPPAAADLVSPLKAVTARDPTVKGGRWDPEFVWNTDWERAVSFWKGRGAGGLSSLSPHQKRAGAGPPAIPSPLPLSVLTPCSPLSTKQLEASDRVTAPKVAAASAALEAAAEGRMLKTSAPAADFLTGGEGGAPSTSADLSSSRRAALADPALDLTASLLAPRSPLVPGAVPVGRGGGRAGDKRGAAVGRRAAAASAAAAAAARGGGGGGRPTWGPDGRLAPPAAPPAPVPVARAPAPWSAPGDAAARAAAAAAEAVAYEAMKRDLMAWTVGAGVAGTALAAAFYSRDVALSYALGALGGAIYLRLLNKSVDGLGGGGGLGSASAGPPRLLVPIILAAGSNRYNTLVSASSGITLALLPMLVGFFTYKVAVVGRQGLILLGDLAADAGKEGRGK